MRFDYLNIVQINMHINYCTTIIETKIEFLVVNTIKILYNVYCKDDLVLRVLCFYLSKYML